jgi:cell division protein FtsZ
MIEVADTGLEELRPQIRIFGVGGAGGNAIANMIRHGVQGVDFIVANTDAQALRSSPASTVIQLGRTTTEGLGAGSHAEIGRAAAEESLPEIERALEGAHMCFVAAGMGGGTGTGAAPVIAKAARARGILTVGVVTKPFGFEGSRRAKAAEAGLEALREHVDTLIVVPNQNLFRIASPATTFKQAFDLADEILQQGVRGITDLMVMPGLINLDFADVRTVMRDMGRAMMGMGEAEGDDRALRAAQAAVANPLIDEAIKGARGLIISITGGEDMGLLEVDEAASHIQKLVDKDADIIWGSAFNPELNGRIRVSIVATGLGTAESEAAAQPAAEQAAAAPAVAQPIAEQPAVAATLAAESAIQAVVAPKPIAAPLPVFDPHYEPEVARAAARLEPKLQPEMLAEPKLEAQPQPRIAIEPEAIQPAARPALKLIPPSQADMAAAEAQRALAAQLAQRGPSLFDRMAMAARHAAASTHLRQGAPLPRITDHAGSYRAAVGAL